MGSRGSAMGISQTPARGDDSEPSICRLLDLHLKSVDTAAVLLLRSPCLPGRSVQMLRASLWTGLTKTSVGFLVWKRSNRGCCFPPTCLPGPRAGPFNPTFSLTSQFRMWRRTFLLSRQPWPTTPRLRFKTSLPAWMSSLPLWIHRTLLVIPIFLPEGARIQVGRRVQATRRPPMNFKTLPHCFKRMVIRPRTMNPVAQVLSVMRNLCPSNWWRP